MNSIRKVGIRAETAEEDDEFQFFGKFAAGGNVVFFLFFF